MFPIRDNIHPRRTPVVTWALIALNVAVFAWQVSLGADLEPTVMRLALVPTRLLGALAGQAPVLPQVGTVFTSMFLHGDILHLLGNMWFLWIFGDNVEDRFGRLGYLAFYFACGAVAAAAQVRMAPDSDLPMIGASGAIAGVLGAYLRFYPSARVLTLVPIFFFVQFIEVPAVVFLGLWFLLQFVSNALGDSGVAWWAHIAGFAAGIAFSFLVRGAAAPQRRAPDPRVRVRRVRY
jgi:membrane associated rhomboid family serine protease